MILRPFHPDDEPKLKEMHSRFGYDWPFPDDLSNYQILTDDSGRILMAAGWKLVPEVTMMCDPDKCLHPLVKLKGIALLHNQLRAILIASGYNQAVAYIAPELKRFSRHLQREFGWLAEWPCLRIHVGEVSDGQ